MTNIKYQIHDQIYRWSRLKIIEINFFLLRLKIVYGLEHQLRVPFFLI